MSKFSVGDWIIDTVKEQTADVCYVFEDSSPQLYVLLGPERTYYIQEEDYLIPYDKHWFDRFSEEETENDD